MLRALHAGVNYVDELFDMPLSLEPFKYLH